jgi:hypothetical protein
MKITQYFVCSDSGLQALQKAVNDAIAKGWQPLGGVSAVTWKDGNMVGQMFFQAVVTYQ